jgi:hypothetical protein
MPNSTVPKPKKDLKNMPAGKKRDPSHCQQVKKGEHHRQQRIGKFYPRISLF